MSPQKLRFLRMMAAGGQANLRKPSPDMFRSPIFGFMTRPRESRDHVLVVRLIPLTRAGCAIGFGGRMKEAFLGEWAGVPSRHEITDHRWSRNYRLHSSALCAG